ncbi:unnamed protein product [Calypogeia fissa]
MSGGRPDSEAARRGGLVPFTGSSNGRNNNSSGNTTNGTNGSAGYPNINSNKAGNFAANPAQDNVKTSSKGGNNNNHLWSNNGSGTYTQGSAPAWNDNQQGAPTGAAAPVNNGSNNFDTRQTAGPVPVGGGYIQGPQQQQPQQQPQAPNFQGRNVQQGVPVNPSNNRQSTQAAPGGGYVQGTPAANGNQQQQQPNWQGPQGGYITGGPQRGPMPKGDYVYYDGSGNQIQPGAAGPPPGVDGSGHWTGSGSERQFHHHYYYNQQQNAAPVGYPYNKNLEQKKKRRPGAKALAAALIACWACTCCCHAPCGW